MGEAVIFTPEVAEALMAQGFKLVARTDKAYYFEDSVLLWCATNKLLMELARKGL